MKLNLSVPFLATRIAQLTTGIGNTCVEATIFNRADLDEAPWGLVWRNIKSAADRVGPTNVTFHFPVNASDYVADAFVRSRLVEAIRRASDLGLHGIVVHSNRIRPLAEWLTMDLEDERSRVIEVLLNARRTCPSPTFLALENMPVMDNYGIEIDPLFCYPADFEHVMGSPLGIVWDLCHFTNTLATIEEVIHGQQNRAYYPNVQTCALESFVVLRDQIAHWHFSAFQGVPNPDTGAKCIEGVLPHESTLPESIYEEAWRLVRHHKKTTQHVVLEIVEKNYEARMQIPKMIQWMKTRGHTSPLR